MFVCDRKLLLRTLVCVWLTNFCFHYGFYSYCLVLFCFYFLSEWINPKFRYFLIFFSTVCWYFSSRLGACCCISTCLICFHFQWMLSFFFHFLVFAALFFVLREIISVDYPNHLVRATIFCISISVFVCMNFVRVLCRLDELRVFVCWRPFIL